MISLPMWNRISTSIKAFLRRIDAQDLVEYTLLLAFVGLVAVSIVVAASGGVQGIWGASNDTLAAANSSADSQAATPSDGHSHHGHGGGHGHDGH